MTIGQVLNRVVFIVWRWLAIAALLSGLVSAAQVSATPVSAAADRAGTTGPAGTTSPRLAAQVEGEPDDFTLYLPVAFAVGRDDLLAAESNLTARTVSAGYAHSCAVLPDGLLTCWGLDSSGQASPLPGEYRSVSAGSYHTCGLRADGTLACWGADTYGKASPPAGVFQQVSGGGEHACALRADGSIACWGWNGFGQLDNIPAGSFTEISAGDLHTCALRADGSLACWGWNADGQTNVPAGSYSQVSAGGQHTCAVTSGGALACWGSNVFGQSNPPSGSFRAVSAGSQHTCALRVDGSIACWGSNGFGQLNEIPEGAFQDLGAGGQHTCAVRASSSPGESNAVGTLACWGWNRYGQSFPPSGVRASAGFAHACAVRVDGSLVCWGENESGQNDAPAGLFIRVSAGSQHSCAVDRYGDLACWGSDAAGQASAPEGTFLNVSAGGQHSCALGLDGTLACWGSSSAGQSAAPAGTFSQVSAGNEHSCALGLNGALTCWGSNSAGQSTAPLAGTFSQVSAGGEHSCALTTLGTVTCWGSNTAGQSTAPTGTFAQVSAGDRHSCGVRADGSLSCWGDNRFGQINAPLGIYSQVSAGGEHSCAVPLDGQVVCWGSELEVSELTLSPDSLPEAQAGLAYNQTIRASGGTPPYTFQLTSGALPEGLALSAAGELSGTPAAAGSYNFTIQVSDSAIPTASGQRAYTLLVSPAPSDSTPPVISASVSGPQGKEGWYVGPVTVTWTVTDAESAVSVQSGCDTVTLSEDTPGVTLTCSATSAGGSSTESVTVKIDQTPPEKVQANPEREPDSNGWYNHALEVSFSGTDPLSGIASCTSLVYDGPDSAEASVSGTCTDRAGNTSPPVLFTFQYDATAPVLNPVVIPNPVYLNGEAQVKANASDALSGLAEVKCQEPDTSTVGLKKVTCRAEDAAGNLAKAHAAYSVIYRFLGFLPPVENPPAVNRVVAGQTVPIKFRLADDSGAPVSDLEQFEVQIEKVQCPFGAPQLDLAEQYELSLMLNQGGGSYHYNWKTSSDLSGACVRLTVDLGEGPEVEHAAYFYFRK